MFEVDKTAELHCNICYKLEHEETELEKSIYVLLQKSRNIRFPPNTEIYMYRQTHAHTR